MAGASQSASAHVNATLSLWDLQAWKPTLTALLLPPVPLLLMLLIGARQLATRRRGGWMLVWLAVVGLWLSCTTGAALALADAADLLPPPLSAARLQTLAAQVKQRAASGRMGVAIVVLGGGRELLAPEYDAANLSAESLQRLRHGIWLSRATGAPLAFSGGHGWAQKPGEAEADIAARVAADEFGHPLHWTENASRDTRENAANTVPLLEAAGIEHLLLVTHGGHMRRALRAFEVAAGGRMVIEAAPIGLARGGDHGLVDWLPSGSGSARFREMLREWVGLRFGA